MLESIGYVYVKRFKTEQKIWIAKSITFWAPCESIIILTSEAQTESLIKVK